MGAFTFDSRLADQAMRSHRISPVVLMDVQTFNGTTYYLSNLAGNYPAVIGSGTVAYKEWVKKCGPVTLHRSTQVDVGDVTLQNLSGNTIQRDMMVALAVDEFWGALAVIRWYDLLLQEAILEFHANLGKPAINETEVTFKVKDSFDLNIVQLVTRVYQTSCDLNFKGARCGSVGSATTCDFQIATCQDVNHNAFNRFTGIPNPPSLTILPAATVTANNALGLIPTIRGQRYF